MIYIIVIRVGTYCGPMKLVEPIMFTDQSNCKSSKSGTAVSSQLSQQFCEQADANEYLWI